MALSKIDSSSVNGLGYGFKNRIINGDMRIDQRNAGASVAFASGVNTYALDRWYIDNATDGAFSIEQVEDAPAGLYQSTKLTVTTADASIGSTQDAIIGQRIEGSNITDLGFGTASASTVTLSFWVKSSLTGSFGGSLMNSAYNRAYPFSFTISAANTWEQKTVTIAGDTSGTWLSTNGIGIRVSFSMAAGSSYSGTPNAWASSLIFQPTGSTNVIGTNGATFYITGVQLEKGTVATEFDYRPYGAELQLCQRYYWKPTNGVAYLHLPLTGYCDTSTTGVMQVVFPTTMRSGPSVTSSGTFQVIPGANGVSTFAMDAASGDVARINITGSGFATNVIKFIRNGNDTTAYIAFSSEL